MAHAVLQSRCFYHYVLCGNRARYVSPKKMSSWVMMTSVFGDIMFVEKIFTVDVDIIIKMLQ